MTHIALLKEIEEFLRKDLANERLAPRAENRRKILLNKISGYHKGQEEQEKIDKFLAKQRQVSRLQSPENERSNSLSKSTEQESDECDGHYMDLSDIPDSNSGRNHLKVDPPLSCGSGSGYESYESDDESRSTSRTKSSNEENLDQYFTNTECDIYTYIFLENNKFLSGKKWVKRVGVVTENHLKCYKKPNDWNAVLDIPLRSYAASTSNKEGTSSVIFTLSAGNEGDIHRFYVEQDKVEEWSKVMKEKTTSLSSSISSPPPPVAARPVSTLPRGQEASSMGLHRQSSLGVSGCTKVTVLIK